MGRIMGLDIGDRTIGVAVSDLLGITAQGVQTIKRRNFQWDLQQLEKVIKKHGVGKIIVGLPKNMNGTIGAQGEKVLAFAEKLEKTTGIPVEAWDERLTSVSAEKFLLEGDMSRKKRKEVIDKIAAVIILQNYLDYKELKGGRVKDV